MSIQYKKFAESVQKPEVKEKAQAYRDRFGEHQLILSVDRLDYSKGILQRLKAFDQLLTRYPEYEGAISLILVVVPSRSKVKHYQHLKEEIDEMVGYINGKYSGLDWMPISYFYRSLPFQDLSALYSIADIGLVTPFRDGMNLIAKEFVASRADQKGVLVLSEMAGSAIELSEAVLINPNDINTMVDSLREALQMPEEEQKRRNKMMQEKLQKYTVEDWAQDFLDRLQETQETQEKYYEKYLDQDARQTMIQKFQSSKKRLVSLDYDGTLTDFTKEPEKAGPSEKVLAILEKLEEDPHTSVIITSGRDREILEEWFGHLDVDIIGEHGAWLKGESGKWETIHELKSDWKDEVRPILNDFTVKTPGTFIEEKEYALVWHYRKADSWIAEIRVRDLLSTLSPMARKDDLQVLEGNKIVEVKNAGINKGIAIQKWLQKADWDFIMAIGDDWTDEDTFGALPEEAHTIKVGLTSSTEAQYNLRSPEEVVALLQELSELTATVE